MSTIHTHAAELAELPEITRRDRAIYVAQARRLRGEQIDRLIAAAGRPLARFGNVLIGPFIRNLHTNTRTG
jgi:hypothetical protein